MKQLLVFLLILLLCLFSKLLKQGSITEICQSISISKTLLVSLECVLSNQHNSITFLAWERRGSLYSDPAFTCTYKCSKIVPVFSQILCFWCWIEPEHFLLSLPVYLGFILCSQIGKKKIIWEDWPKYVCACNFKEETYP